MPKLSKFPKLALFIFIAFFTLKLTFAADFTLTRIGGLDTTGKNYTEWWYKGTNPMLVGTGAPNIDVTIKINEETFTAPMVDDLWSYQTNLAEGDHNFIISQGESSISFVLHLGQDAPLSNTIVTNQDGTAVPDTGFNQYAAFGLGLGVILLASYFYISQDSNKKTVFETRLIKED